MIGSTLMCTKVLPQQFKFHPKMQKQTVLAICPRIFLRKSDQNKNESLLFSNLFPFRALILHACYVFPLIFLLRGTISRFFLSTSAQTAPQSSFFLSRDYSFSGSVFHSILSSNTASPSFSPPLLLFFLLQTLLPRPATSTIRHRRRSFGFALTDANTLLCFIPSK